MEHPGCGRSVTLYDFVEQLLQASCLLPILSYSIKLLTAIDEKRLYGVLEVSYNTPSYKLTQYGRHWQLVADTHDPLHR